MNRVYALFGGISEFYAFVFAGTLIALAFKNLLGFPFAGAVAAIQALVVTNDIHNDLHK